MDGNIMSINRLMKMRCNSYRNPILNNPGAMDAYSNNIEPVWDLIDENDKCFIQNYEPRSSNYTLEISGPKSENLYIGFFFEEKNIGDRIVVTLPENSFPTLYIKSKSPQIRAVTGKTHHHEYMLSIEAFI